MPPVRMYHYGSEVIAQPQGADVTTPRLNEWGAFGWRMADVLRIPGEGGAMTMAFIFEMPATTEDPDIPDWETGVTVSQYHPIEGVISADPN